MPPWPQLSPGSVGLEKLLEAEAFARAVAKGDVTLASRRRQEAAYEPSLTIRVGLGGESRSRKRRVGER